MKSSRRTLPALLGITVTTLVSMTSIPSADAEIYRWVDESGQVHYGEQRPADKDASRMEITIREPVRKPEKEQDDTSKDQPADTEATGQPNSESEPAERELSRREKRRLCKDSKARLESILSRARLKGRDKQGNVVALTPKQRDKRIRQVRKDIRQYCR